MGKIYDQLPADDNGWYSELNDAQVQYFIKQGVTPLKLELAYKTHTVRDFGGQFHLKQHEIRALRRRWLD